jgi:hypothetical protein
MFARENIWKLKNDQKQLYFHEKYRVVNKTFPSSYIAMMFSIN